jgi:hypothetical protein
MLYPRRFLTEYIFHLGRPPYNRLAWIVTNPRDGRRVRVRDCSPVGVREYAAKHWSYPGHYEELWIEVDPDSVNLPTKKLRRA